MDHKIYKAYKAVDHESHQIFIGKVQFASCYYY